MGGSGQVNIAAQPDSVGTLYLGFGNEAGTLSAGSVVFGEGAGFLNFYHSGDLPFAIPISGPGAVSKAGAGANETLSADSGYSGGTRVLGGTLRITNANGLGLGSGPATVEDGPDSRLLFANSASAGAISITNQRGVNGVTSATTVFQENATAATATITNEASIAAGQIGGRLFFVGNARRDGAGHQCRHGGRRLDRRQRHHGIPKQRFGGVRDDQQPRQHQQFGQGGFTNFRNSSTAGASIINNRRSRAFGSFGFGGETDFFDSSRAGTATILNEGGDANGTEGLLDFGNSAGADKATITHQGSNIANNGGLTRFFGTSTAGQATMIFEAGLGASGSGGRVWFFETSTAGNATLRANGGTLAGGPGQSRATGGAIEFRGSERVRAPRRSRAIAHGHERFRRHDDIFPKLDCGLGGDHCRRQCADRYARRRYQQRRRRVSRHVHGR